MIFLLIMILTTFAIAAAAAYFSVYGMAHLFTGATIPVIIMGASLEAGKLVAASFLYRYRQTVGWALKIYLTLAVFLLMVITSMGIFGFLSAAYQQDTLPLTEMQEKITLYQDEHSQLLERRQQIDKQIADVGPNYVRAKQRLVAEFADERKRIDDRITELVPEIQKLKTDQINVTSKVGPIMLVAKVLGKEPDTAVFWFTLLLIICFDPLAVGLSIACNQVIMQRKEEKKSSELNKIIHLDDSSNRLEDSPPTAYTSDGSIWPTTSTEEPVTDIPIVKEPIDWDAITVADPYINFDNNTAEQVDAPSTTPLPPVSNPPSTTVLLQS